jgi:hypothetical protein
MSEEQRLLRVGVLGAGPISQAAHFEACRKAKNAELYAICEVAEDLLERMSAIHRFELRTHGVAVSERAVGNLQRQEKGWIWRAEKHPGPVWALRRALAPEITTGSSPTR